MATGVEDSRPAKAASPTDASGRARRGDGGSITGEAAGERQYAGGVLRNTFCHVAGVGSGTERKLWQAGVRAWDDVAGAASLPLPLPRADALRLTVAESAVQLAAQDVGWFAARLRANEQWRLFPHFADSTAYLDIETTGLGGGTDHITTIVLYDGKTIRHYVHGRNLEQFGPDVRQYRLLVTYNGRCFDVPFIRQTMSLPMEQANIDLRFVMNSMGIRGGLKGVERQFGLDRGRLADLDGYFAVLLWQEYLRGDRGALETLLAYNALDVVNLATLMPLAYNRKVDETPFSATHRLAVPEPPPVPFEVDHGTIHRIRRRVPWRYGR